MFDPVRLGLNTNQPMHAMTAAASRIINVNKRREGTALCGLRDIFIMLAKIFCEAYTEVRWMKISRDTTFIMSVIGGASCPRLIPPRSESLTAHNSSNTLPEVIKA